MYSFIAACMHHQVEVRLLAKQPGHTLQLDSEAVLGVHLQTSQCLTIEFTGACIVTHKQALQGLATIWSSSCKRSLRSKSMSPLIVLISSSTSCWNLSSMAWRPPTGAAIRQIPTAADQGTVSRQNGSWTVAMCRATHFGAYSQTGSAEGYSSCLLSLCPEQAFPEGSGGWRGQGF